MRKRTSGAGAGEIAEVHGGGRSNDRRSKVCTAKGTRDRRVRLSANTAIQFYDVQDRLGYDRASNAVDWLIAKAKAAIDELRELPPLNPTAAADGGDGMYESSNLFPPPVDKSVQFQSFPSANWLHGHSQDLELSLQSLQDHSQNQNLFTEAAQFSFDSDTNPIGWINSGGGFMLIPPHGGVDSNCVQSLSQREPLQSSNSPLIRARINGNSFGSTSTNNGGASNQDYHQAVPIHPRSLSGIEYASIAARIQGDQEDHDGDPYRSSSVSSASRH